MAGAFKMYTYGKRLTAVNETGVESKMLCTTHKEEMRLSSSGSKFLPCACRWPMRP